MSNKVVSNCAVIIPIHKENLSVDEEKSLRQCFNILGGYPIIFISPRGLNCEKYKSVYNEYETFVNYEFFDKKFFADVNAYSALMVSYKFYERFLNYEYILIYQLDAFVFENNLTFWCELDYDYIGGPVFELRRGANAPEHTIFLNGGFSLRKTKVFYKIAKTKLRFNVFVYLLLSKYDILFRKQTIFNLLKLVVLFLLTRFLYKFFKLEVNEDFEWSLKIRKFGNIAPFDKALRFSFDSCPEYAFKLNNNSLPLGCHGWTSYYNRLFWKEFVT